MSHLHTHYDNLKVTRNAPPEVIRAAYKTLCRKFHPDHHPDEPGVTHTFQLISAAYSVLSDPDQRRRHDQWIAETELQAAGHNTPQHQQLRRASDRRRQTGSRLYGHFSALLSRLWRPSRNLAIWASMLLISAMLIVLYHA